MVELDPSDPKRRRYAPVKTAMKFKIRKIRESRLTPSGGRGSKEGCRRIGISAAKEVMRGMRALRRRYSSFEDGLIALPARA